MTSDRYVETDPTLGKIMDSTEEHRRNSVIDQVEPQGKV